MSAHNRSCGACSLCCTVLRVDALAKVGGEPCAYQRGTDGCGVYARRPEVCRAYRCLWLKGALRDDDRPDALGAVLDLVPRGNVVTLEIREASPGAFERSQRLQEIAAEYRGQHPVRITDVSDVMSPLRSIRILLADGEEQRVRGDSLTLYRDGARIGERRLPWAERAARRINDWFVARKLRRVRARGVPRLDE